MEFSLLRSAERFENLCKQILFIIYPNLDPSEERVKAIDGRGGDSGTDSFIGTINNQLHIFQFKWFTESLKPHHWTKIKNSLKLSSSKNPKKWTLFVATELKESDWKKWEELQNQYPCIRLDIFDKSRLQSIVLANKFTLALEFSELFPTLEAAETFYNLMAQTKQQPLPLIKTDQSNLPIIRRYEDKNLKYLSEHELQKIRSAIEKFNELFYTLGMQIAVEQERNIKSLLKLGLYYINSEKYDNAIFVFDLILREYPDDLRTLNNKAVILERKGNFDIALELLNRALNLFSDFTDAAINRGLLLIDSKINPLEGLRVLERLYNQKIEHQTNKNVLQGLVKAYSSLADLEKTLYYYKKAKSANVEEGILDNTLGIAYFNAGKFYQALECFDSIIKKNPDNIDILINKSATLVELSLYYMAQNLLEKVIEQKQGDAGAIANLALSYHKQNEFDLAIIYGERAYRLNDHDYINLNNLGLFYSAVGDYEKSIDYFNRSLTVNGDFAPALYNKAANLVKLGRLKEAVECIEKLLSYDPILLGEFYDINLYNKNRLLQEIEQRNCWPNEFK